MKKSLTQKQIGKQIAELRKKKGFSQKELAEIIEIPRSALTQIELGKRSIDLQEFQKLSYILEFSLDDFMSNKFNTNEKLENTEYKIEKQKERISIPSLQVNKFKNILLYILEHCAGKPNVGETVLYKLLYFSDFNYYELYEEHLTGAEYRKLPYGPVPQKLNFILSQMIEDEQIQKIKVMYFEKIQTRYLPLTKPDLKVINGAEKEVIDKVIEQYSDWSASSISSYSHKDLPWEVTEQGKVIDYELAFYRAKPYSVRNYEEDVEENDI